MSRLKKYTRSLISSYFMLGANIFYTLASVPLALHYLSKPEFGLWALVSQLGGYITLVDLGMSSSVSRILIDHKDNQSNGAYGSVIKTGALVGLVQGALIIGVGTVLAFLVGPLLKVPVDLNKEFIWIMIGQVLLLAISFGARIFSQILFAHQRLDISNYGSTAAFFLTFAAMWIGFAAGFGIFSFLIGQAVLALSTIIVNFSGCVRLRLLPTANEWGNVSWRQFKELFVFGQGVFLISVGGQIINTSQTILITRFLGLDAVATWTVCTRSYTMLTMLVWRIFDYSAPAFSEMVVRKEFHKLLGRMRDITVLLSALSIFCGIIFAVANGSFVWIWTAGKISWPTINNFLLGAWFFVCSIMRVHSGLVGITKNLRFLRFIYLVEGLVFIGLNLILYRFESMTLMLVLSLVCTLMFTLPYSLFRTQKYFQMTRFMWKEWLKPSWQLTWRLVPVALITWWLTKKFSPQWQIVFDIAVPGVWGVVCLFRYGLGRSLPLEIERKMPSLIQPLIQKLIRNS